VTSTDAIELRGLRLSGVVGVLPHEQEQAQPLELDLDVVVDLGPAGTSDDLADTVDYGTLTLRVKEAVERDPVDLVETVAQRVADVCLSDDRVGWAEVTLHKPQAPIEAAFQDVALTIHRSRG
jgi:dihydroneopterin aldolase